MSNIKTPYYDLLKELVADLQERANKRRGSIAELVIEEKLIRKKYQRRKTLYLIIKDQFVEIVQQSALVIKNEGTIQVREYLSKQIIHNYFCFGMHRPYAEKKAERFK